MKQTLYIGIVLLLCSNLFSANPDSTVHQPVWKIVQQDVFSSAYDAAYVLTSPLHFNGADWLTAGGVAAGTAVIFPLDEPIRNFMKEQHGAVMDQIMSVGRWYGTGMMWRITFGTFYLGGLILNNDHIRTTGRLVLEAELMAQYLSSQSKILFGRSRPYQEEGPYKFRPLQGLLGASLPSGHAITASTFTTIMVLRIQNQPLHILLYGLAGITAISRVYHDAHWTSDVVLGSAMGYFLARGICTINRDTARRNHWQVGAAPGGMVVRYIF